MEHKVQAEIQPAYIYMNQSTVTAKKLGEITLETGRGSSIDSRVVMRTNAVWGIYDLCVMAPVLLI